MNLTFLGALIAKALRSSFEVQGLNNKEIFKIHLQRKKVNLEKMNFHQKENYPHTKKGTSLSFRSCKFEEKLCLLQPNISRQEL